MRIEKAGKAVGKLLSQYPRKHRNTSESKFKL